MGVIFDIQRYSVHDGPGIRTLVFLKGCPLRCKWCCNPESFVKEPQTMMMRGEPVLTGREASVEDVMETVLKDIAYYRRSKGGVTLSGGEPLFQAEFASEILSACKKRGIHTAIETSAAVDYTAFEKSLPFLDLLMVDVKHMSGEKHSEYTGMSNTLTLENVKKLAAESSVEMIVRVPVVPGFNDTPIEISEIAAFVSTMPRIKQLHLLPYHRMGEDKYRGLGLNFNYPGLEPTSNDGMLPLLETAKTISKIHCQIGG
jgi:pyruvate formate lyase activating enzyme